MFNLNSSPEISGLLLKISCATHEVQNILYATIRE